MQLHYPTACPTLAAVDHALEAEHAREDIHGIPRGYLGMSGINKDCQRAVWYDFHWCSEGNMQASGIKAIQDGFAGEVVMAERLRKVPGIQLWTEGEDGKQIACESLSGHFRGHLDGVILGLLQSPRTAHVWEHKQVNEKKFKALHDLIMELGEKFALAEWDPIYFGQAQLYMHHQRLSRHYLTVSTPGGRKQIACRTEYQRDVAEAIMARAKTIIEAEVPPVRLSNDPAYYQCGWCRHKAICHQAALPRVNCRTCAHVTPMLDEQGGWDCRRHTSRVPLEYQQQGCDQHLYHPDLLSIYAQPVDGNPQENWIAYETLLRKVRFRNGPAGHGISSVELRRIANESHEEIFTPTAAALADPIISEFAQTFGATVVAVTPLAEAEAF